MKKQSKATKRILMVSEQWRKRNKLVFEKKIYKLHLLQKNKMALTISKEFWDDQQWGFQHHQELIRKYKDQWIAIVNKQVVSAGVDLGKVETEAKQKTGKEEIPVFF